jgi:hypothetical protein
MYRKRILGAACLIVLLPLMALGSVINIGGTGAISTDSVYGSQGLLSGGETATATFDFTVSGSTLTLTVTNTSPSVPGTEVPTGDAPVISDMFFHVPSDVIGMQFLTGAGVAAASSGWDFIFNPDHTPSTGFGFLKKVFDAGLEGGPGPGSPDPVIASINDPNIFDGPGDPLASPVDFVFTLLFLGGQAPAGFSGDWFTDPGILGDPVYLAAAKFMSGANGGSATVTDGVDGGGHQAPEPAALVLVFTGLLAAIAGRRRLSITI